MEPTSYRAFLQGDFEDLLEDREDDEIANETDAIPPPGNRAPCPPIAGPQILD